MRKNRTSTIKKNPHLVIILLFSNSSKRRYIVCNSHLLTFLFAILQIWCRAKNAVSHFCVGSAEFSPKNVKLQPSSSLYICGDWIDRKGHASWSTEKAVVTARQAAAALAQDLDLTWPSSSPSPVEVIPAASDTVQLSTVRRMAQSVRRTTTTSTPSSVLTDDDNDNTNSTLLPVAPWVLAKRLLSGL